MFSATKGGSPSGYQISRSVRLRSSASAYFNRTPASAGNRQAWTWSGWVKRGALGGSANILFSASTGGTNPRGLLAFTSTDTIEFGDNPTGSAWYSLVTTPVYRDPSGWYHIVAVWDSANATSGDRLRLYVNGIRLTAFGTASYPPINTNSATNTAIAHGVGRYDAGGTLTYFDGYLTEINFIDGQALTPASFGETNPVTGVWQPKKYTGTYGTNGFYLNFSDNSGVTSTTIGADYSGNGNNWTPNNISVTAGATYDSMLDVPTQWADGGNGRGNYAVMNPLDTASGVFANANLNVSTTSGRARGTIFVASGKWYWEATITSMPSTTVFGIADTSYKIGTSNDSQSRGYVSTGSKISNGSSSAYGASFTTGDTIGVAYDVDAGTLTFYKNNTSQGTAYSDIAGYSWAPYVQGGFGADFNFGQRPFSYTPPTGFKALNTLNLPEPTILKGNQYFDATTYTGTGASRSVTNAGGFQPDLVWMKDRGNVVSHILFDAQRGTNNFLRSNTTDAATTNTTMLTAFNSDGFSLGTDSAGAVNVNNNNYVAWQWKEGATQGFDIVLYTGNSTNRTIAHSLGVAPSMMIVKNRTNGTSDWRVWHSALAGTEYLTLNTTAAKATGLTQWNSTVPTSTVFSLGVATATNGSGDSLVAYLFAEVAGFSKFGSYTGNGSADGTFVFCGFRPAFVMVKRTDSTSSWGMYDSARDTYNVVGNQLNANLSDSEYTAQADLDFTSNGFKIRRNVTQINASGGTYIFAAFCENPFKNALAR